MLVKILGFIDIVASVILFSMVFSLVLPLQLVISVAGLLFVKSLFILRGDLLSFVDLIASFTLFIGIL